MKTMKPHCQRSFPFLARIVVAAMAALALSTAQLSASGPAPSVLSKMDDELALVAKTSRSETSAEKPATRVPDVYAYRGRVLVEIQGTFSRELSDQIANLGGEVVAGWGTTTNFRAWVPFAQLETLAARADVRFLSAARPSITHRTERPR
jgi:hypothetical protein